MERGWREGGRVVRVEEMVGRVERGQEERCSHILCMFLHTHTLNQLGYHRGGRVGLPPAAQTETVASHTPHPLTNWLAEGKTTQPNTLKCIMSVT